MVFSVPTLGQLTRIDAREVWKHEALHFTPWLRDHIDLLADALQMELELPETEVPVGEFSCDIVARDAIAGHQVVIENQLAQTDHGHLGQALTYAAGRDAKTVVWISPEFRDPHRQAIDWLNANTGEDLNFFGVEVELLKIDDSAPAVHFKVVAQPNNWQKVIKQPTQVSEKGLQYQLFWSDLRETYAKNYPGHGSAKHTSTYNWLTVGSAGRSGFAYIAAFTSKGQLKVELSWDVGSQPMNKATFDSLHAEKDEIEMSAGVELSWERLDHAKSSRIVAYRDALVTDVDPKRQAHLDWAAEMLGKLRTAFKPQLAKLQLSPAEESEVLDGPVTAASAYD